VIWVLDLESCLALAASDSPSARSHLVAEETSELMSGMKVCTSHL